MGAIINIFSNIFKSIIGLITGLFGGKSSSGAAKPVKGKDGFFLEAPAAVANSVAGTAASNSVASNSVASNSVVATVAAATSTATTDPATTDKTAKKGAKGKAAVAAAAAAVAAAAPVMPKVMDPVDIINAALAQSSKVAAAQSGTIGGLTFAEMNAMPMATNDRRRPGANMTGFLTMAKNVNRGKGSR
jgi:hypothetical protein